MSRSELEEIAREAEQLRADRETFLKSSAVGYAALTRAKFDLERLLKDKASEFKYLDEAISKIAGEDQILREICHSRGRKLA
jgi:hypothetical protein